MAFALVIRLKPGRASADIRIQGQGSRQERVETLRLAAFLAPQLADLEAYARLWAALQQTSQRGGDCDDGHPDE